MRKTKLKKSKRLSVVTGNEVDTEETENSSRTPSPLSQEKATAVLIGVLVILLVGFFFLHNTTSTDVSPLPSNSANSVASSTITNSIDSMLAEVERRKNELTQRFSQENTKSITPSLRQGLPEKSNPILVPNVAVPVLASVTTNVQSSLPLSSTGSSSNTNPTPTTTVSQQGANGVLDIVIGMAQDTDPKNLVVFCNSFREHVKPQVNRHAVHSSC